MTKHRITFKESTWTIRRQPSVAAGARADGEAAPQAPPSGLVFTSERGEHRFLAFSGDRLPNDEEVARVDAETFAKWLATSVKGNG